MFYNFKAITLSGAARVEQVGACAPGVGLKAHQHTLFKHLKNEFFSRNLVQNLPKMRIFLDKRL